MEAGGLSTSRALAAIADALGAVEHGERRGLPAAVRLGLVQHARVVARRVEALLGVLVSEADAAGASLVARGTPTTSWLTLDGTSSSEAAGLVFAGQDLTRHQSVQQAALEGEVSVRQARTIEKVMKVMPAGLDAAQEAAAASVLVGMAKRPDPKRPERAVREVLQQVAPEAIPTPESEQQHLEAQRRRAWGRRELSFFPDGDGAVRIRGCLPVLEASQLEKLVDAYVEAGRRAARDAGHRPASEHGLRLWSGTTTPARPGAAARLVGESSSAAGLQAARAGCAAEGAEGSAGGGLDAGRSLDAGGAARGDLNLDGSARGGLNPDASTRGGLDADGSTRAALNPDSTARAALNPDASARAPLNPDGSVGGAGTRAMSGSGARGVGVVVPPGSGGTADAATPAQRRADALMALVAAHEQGRRAPGVGGDRPRIVVTMREGELRERAEQAGVLDSGAEISAGELRRLCCDADLTPAVLGTGSEVLDVGTTARLVTPAIRRALTLRDGQCVFPGCDVTADACEAHHIEPWWSGGRTALNNLVLLCPHHHALVEPPRFWSGAPPDRWQVRINDHGLPQIIPPRRLNAEAKNAAAMLGPPGRAPTQLPL